MALVKSSSTRPSTATETSNASAPGSPWRISTTAQAASHPLGDKVASWATNSGRTSRLWGRRDLGLGIAEQAGPVRACDPERRSRRRRPARPPRPSSRRTAGVPPRRGAPPRSSAAISRRLLSSATTAAAVRTQNPAPTASRKVGPLPRSSGAASSIRRTSSALPATARQNVVRLAGGLKWPGHAHRRDEYRPKHLVARTEIPEPALVGGDISVGTGDNRELHASEYRFGGLAHPLRLGQGEVESRIGHDPDIT